MLRTLTVCVIMMLSYHVSAQDIDGIKTDPSILWAEGVGTSLAEADKMALAELSQQISIEVSSETSRISTSDGKENNVSQQNKIETHSSAVFNNVEMRVISETPHYRVIRWIGRDEITKQNKERLAKVKEMVRIANVALQGKQISDALRYYYWAYSLLSTLPQYGSIKIEDEDSDEQVANIWLPNRIKNVLSKLKCLIGSKSDDGINDYDVTFYYDGSPVVNVDFTYFDGTDWSPVYSALDGKSIVELRPKYNPNQLMIRYEYKFIGESKCDREIEKVLNSGSPSFDAFCSATVKFEPTTNSDIIRIDSKPGVSNYGKTNTHSLAIHNVDQYDRIIRRIINAIRDKDVSNITSLFTSNGHDVFERLIKYGKAKVIGGEPDLTFTKLGDDVICHSVPMNFTFSGNRKFSEEVIFTFDKDGLIDNISFGLGEVAKNNLLGQVHSSFSQEQSEVLADFLECFKTAYALKRIDYLEQLFDDDALIITGKVLHKLSKGNDIAFGVNRYVELTKQDKATYIKHLKRSFASKEFINVKFANNRIRHTKVDGIYAIQIKQDYFSSNYGDSGYLFLIVDIRNPKEPIIHVRAWQEQPDSEWGILGPEFF